MKYNLKAHAIDSEADEHVFTCMCGVNNAGTISDRKKNECREGKIYNKTYLHCQRNDTHTQKKNINCVARCIYLIANMLMTNGNGTHKISIEI